jgi:putative ABC transport system substrate-binding protein
MGQVGRRQFLIATGGVLTAPLIAQAQPRRDGRPYRIAVLFGAGGESMQRYLSALSERLAKLGFVQGQNLHIDVSPAGAFTGAGVPRGVVGTFLEKHPDAFFTCLTSITMAAAQVTQSVPIVFAWVEDPVAAGLVKSLAHPDGNVTGVTNRFAELLLKRLELARELVPELKRVALIGYGEAGDAMYEPSVRPLRRAAAQFGIEVLEFVTRPWVELYQQAADEGAGAVIPVGIFVPYGDRFSGELVIESARKRDVPVIFAGVEMVEAGGLISYGTNIIDDLRRGADLLAKVLRGVKPSDIPVDQAARFELAVNLKTAKASGIAIPQSILLRADRVIE